MTTWATVEDVRARYEKPIPDSDKAQVAVKLSDAEAKIVNKIGAIQAAIDAERTTAENVKIVLCEMVMRWLRNPSGYRTEAVGPFSYTRDGGTASGKLYLTSDDRQMLGMSRGATTVPLADDALRHPTRRPGAPAWWVGNRPPPGYDPDWDDCP